MSIRLMNDVWDHAPFRGAELLVLLSLADQANDKGECWPSVQTIAKRARCSDRWVRDVFVALIEQGWLEKRLRPGTSTLYTVKVPSRTTPEASTPEPYFRPELSSVRNPTSGVGPEPRNPTSGVGTPELSSVLNPSSGGGGSGVQGGAEVGFSQTTIEPPMNTPSSPVVEEWTGPSDENLAWLAAQISTKVDGCVIDLDAITEKMLKARKPQMTSGGWMMAALALLGDWQSKADATSTFTASAVAGDEKPKVRDDEWKPDTATFTAALPDFPLLKDPKVAHEITRQFLDWADGLGKKPEKNGPPASMTWAARTWRTFVSNNYEEATRGHASLRNPQMTGTE